MKTPARIHLALLPVLILLLTGCQKDRQRLSVSGRAHYNDLAKTAAKGAKVSLFVVYDTGSGQYEVLGTTLVDQKGHFEFSANVSLPKRSFKYYQLSYEDHYMSFQDLGNGKTYHNGSINLPVTIYDGEVNLTQDIVIPAVSFVNFHIQNTMPADSNDYFNFIRIYPLYHATQTADLPVHATGMQTDTSISIATISSVQNGNPFRLRYWYYYQKGGNLINSPEDSVLLVPLDTITVAVSF